MTNSRLSVFHRLATALAVIGALAMFAGSAAKAAPLAELAVFSTEDGVKLSALLWSPAGPTKNVMIMIPGGTGGFISGAHDYSPLAEQLNAAGYALLIPNMRTAGRHGWLFGHWEDTEQDVGAAVAYAKSRGLTEILLFGTSFGGPRIAYYWARTREPGIRAMGFLAAITSPYGEAQMRFDEAGRADFDAFLQKARDLVTAGKGTELMSYQWFPRARFTLAAESFLSYFGNPAESDASSIKWAGQITQPSVVIHGRNDEIAFAENPEAIYASLTAAQSRELIWVEKVSHYMTPGPTAEAYTAAIMGWVLKNAPAVK